MVSVVYIFSFQCDNDEDGLGNDFHLIGLNQLTCQENGRWNGTPPCCARKLFFNKLLCCSKNLLNTLNSGQRCGSITVLKAILFGF